VKPIRIGVVGCGNISRSHLASLAAFPERARVVAVADVVRDRADARAKEYGVPNVCRDLGDMLERHGAELDAVDLLTPHHLHCSELTKCLAAGKHVLMEKPICTTLDESRRLRIALSERPDLKVCVGYSWRIGFREVKQAIEAGRIGSVFCAEADYSHRVLSVRDWPGVEWCRFRLNAGPDYGTHATDILLWLLGGDPVEVYALGNKLVAGTLPGTAERDFEDTFLLLFQFRGGQIGKVFMSSAVKVTNTGARIFGTEGTIVVNANGGVARATIQTDAHRAPEEIPIAQGGLHPCPEEIDAFLRSVETGSCQFPLCTAAEAIKDVETFEAIDRSLMTGTRVRIRS